MVKLCWKEEKMYVQNIFDERTDLENLVCFLKKKSDLNSFQKSLIEKYKELDTLLEHCLSVLGDCERKTIKLVYETKLSNLDLAEALIVSERTAATYKRDATVKFAKILMFYSGTLD